VSEDVTVEEALVFDLCVLKTLKDDCDEEIEKDQVHKDVEAQEVENS
jgi:hypothetical protein